MDRSVVYEMATKVLARLLLPVAKVREPREARHRAAQWALGLRFPKESLEGLTPETRRAFEGARTEALWRDGQLIGLTSGYRDAAEQHRLWQELGNRVLRPSESEHVRGMALDVRPTEGARWLERNGDRYSLYSRYDNEPWHFELAQRRPERQPHPGAAPVRRSC
ncbi:D-alanyl-D-alanine carboxypeptidase family protein [Kutzneria sp. CA-103260]|uniref:D-alanyl-D-alanine carboxypeptidase family protein n=1 Tax=Kutzneria sp. CA-103260 TaxID=2802641 RepID=UPI001BA9880D|nr:D-alanyl-D-alanine carboxypeptidase family protein [Kutzneria sp. CA-103260]QUQ68372.1 D-alanyl-D-alanine carboxypeptidase [Kutzneria sp. CA-103260]